MRLELQMSFFKRRAIMSEKKSNTPEKIVSESSHVEQSISVLGQMDIARM